jgi:hypothetical protein
MIAVATVEKRNAIIVFVASVKCKGYVRDSDEFLIEMAIHGGHRAPTVWRLFAE